MGSVMMAAIGRTCSYNHPLLNIFLDIVVLLTDNLHLLFVSVLFIEHTSSVSC